MVLGWRFYWTEFVNFAMIITMWILIYPDRESAHFYNDEGKEQFLTRNPLLIEMNVLQRCVAFF